MKLAIIMKTRAMSLIVHSHMLQAVVKEAKLT